MNLDTGRVEDLILPMEIYRENLGGRGLAGVFLQEATPAAWDDPSAPFLIFTGPLAGTGAPSASSTVFAARSPLTGGVGDAVAGGGLGGRLKRAGYDGIAITGRAQGWTGLEVSSDGATAGGCSAPRVDENEPGRRTARRKGINCSGRPRGCKRCEVRLADRGR